MARLSLISNLKTKDNSFGPIAIFSNWNQNFVVFHSICGSGALIYPFSILISVWGTSQDIEFQHWCFYHLLAFWASLWVNPLTWSLADFASSWRLSYWSAITVNFSNSDIKSWFSLSYFWRFRSDSSRLSTLALRAVKFWDNLSFSWLALVT